MKSISIWAKYHPWSARVSIVLIKITLIVLAVYTGRNLASLNISLSPAVFSSAVIMFLMAAFLYPGAKKKLWLSKQHHYLQQKTSDVVLVVSSFVMICCISNASPENFTQMASGAFSSTSIKVNPTAEEILKSLSYRDKSSLTHVEKRILKNEFKKQLVIYGKAKLSGNKSESDKAGLTILAIIAALGLAFLVGALACNLSCSGSDGAAVAVAVIGLGAIVWLLMVVLKSINKKKKVATNPAPTGNIP